MTKLKNFRILEHFVPPTVYHGASGSRMLPSLKEANQFRGHGTNSKTNETMPPNSYEGNKFSIMQFPPYPRPPPLKKQKSIVSKNTEIYVQGLTDVKKKKERPSQTIKVISPPNVLNVVPSQLVQVSETSKPLRRKRRFKNPVHNEHSYINNWYTNTTSASYIWLHSLAVLVAFNVVHAYNSECYNWKWQYKIEYFIIYTPMIHNRNIG